MPVSATSLGTHQVIGNRNSVRERQSEGVGLQTERGDLGSTKDNPEAGQVETTVSSLQ